MNALMVTYFVENGMGYLFEQPSAIARPMTCSTTGKPMAWPFRVDKSFVRGDGYVPVLLQEAANG
ncbi:hypothetical protein [Xanthomonas phage BUDD]|nr:hypothetical protein [Xanthomonas phage BUDD]